MQATRLSRRERRLAAKENGTSFEPQYNGARFKLVKEKNEKGKLVNKYELIK